MYFDKSYQCEPAGDKSDGSMKIYVRPSHFRNPRQVQTDLQTMTGNITFRLPGNDSFWVSGYQGLHSPQLTLQFILRFSDSHF